MKYSLLFKKICFCILAIAVISSIGVTAYAANNGDSVLGDVNKDGYITNLDRYLLNRYLAGKASLADLDAADLNRDQKVTAEDLNVLSKHLARHQGYQNLADCAVELSVSSVMADKSSMTVGESVTLTVVANRPFGDITMNVEVYLNDSVVEHVSGGSNLQYYPACEGNYRFRVTVNDRSGNEYSHGQDLYLEVEAPTPPLVNPVLMYPNLPTEEDLTYPYFDDDFTLRWNDIEGAVSYTINTYLYEDGYWEEDEVIEGITEPFYEMCYDDAYVSVGQYQFEIIAHDKNGNQSRSDYYYYQWGDNDDILVGMGGKGPTWTLGYEEDDASIWIGCNSCWEAEVSADWITIKYDNGEGAGSTRVWVDENSGDFARTGTVTFTNDYGKQAVFTIVQGPDDSSNQGCRGITYPEYGEIVDYDTFDVEWETGDTYHKLILKDLTTNETVISTPANIGGGWYEIPKSKLSKGHIYQVTVNYYGYSDYTASDPSIYSVVFQVEGDSDDIDNSVGGGSGTRGDTGDDEGATGIILTGLVDGSVVNRQDLRVSWDAVLGATEYNIALRDLTLYPDSMSADSVEQVLNITIHDLSYTVSSGKLIAGHTYRLWIGATKSVARSDSVLLVGKSFRFTVTPEANSGMPSTDFSTATIQHVIGDPFSFEGTVSANGGTLEYVQITVSETATGKYCDYAIYDAVTLGNASSFDLSGVYSFMTGTGSSVQTSGSRYARAGSQTLTLNQTGTRYVITIYARNKGQASNTIVATKIIELAAKPYINVYDENGHSLSGKTISVSYSAFSNKKVFVETNMNIAAWADKSKAFSMVLTETKYTSNGTLYTYTIKGTENPSGVARSGELRIYQSDSGKVTSASTMLASIKINQGGNPNMPVVVGASIKDGNTVYDLNNDLVLKVGDHNYNNGYILVVNMGNSASVNWTVYTDNFRVARTYRDSNGKVYVRANAIGTTSLYISHKYASSYDALDPSALIKICDIRVEDPKNYAQMEEDLAKAVMIPYLYDYLDAESGYDDVSEPLLFILEVMSKGVFGTVEYEINEEIKKVKLDGGQEIIHQMVLSEMLEVNNDWENFLNEFANVAASFKHDYIFSQQEASIVAAMGKLSDNEYIILLDENGGNQSFDNENIRNLWNTLIDNGLTTADLQDDDTMDFYRRMSKAFDAKSIVFLDQASKVMGQLGATVNLAEKFGGYLLLGAMQEEVDTLIDSWIAATDDPNFIAELEAYKKTYSSAGGIVWNSFTDSDVLPGLAKPAAKQIGGAIISAVAEKGALGVAMQEFVKKYIKDGAIDAAIKAISSADSYILVANLATKILLGVDANAVYTAITNLLVIDPIYRDLIEDLCEYGDDYYMYDSYVNKLKLAAALAKLEYKYCIDIFTTDMHIPFNDKKEAYQKFIDEYTAYNDTIEESLDDYIAYVYSLRAQ